MSGSSWVKKAGGQQVAIFRQKADRGAYGCSKFQFRPQISPKWEVFSPNFAFLDQIFGDKENFLTAQNLGSGQLFSPTPSPCHDATDYVPRSLRLSGRVRHLTEAYYYHY